jgi:GxxExxY protein
MYYELRSRNIVVSTNVAVPLFYGEVYLQREFIIDILVSDEIILELKATEGIIPVHQAQLLSYMKLSNKRLGFLINFNVPLIKNGIRRLVNNF